MRFGILGPLDLRTDDGTPLDPGGPRPRALLALLLLDAGRAVSTQRLTDGLYGAEPPAGAANALQSQVSRLRRRLAPHGEIRGHRHRLPPRHRPRQRGRASLRGTGRGRPGRTRRR